MKETYNLADLRNWKQTTAKLKTPIRLGVFGDPVAHSLSPQMQNGALKHCGIALQYARFHILPDELDEALQLIRDLEFVGLNLTVPHKIAALGLLDEIETEARAIGAVNTIAVENGKLRGANTDGRGFSRAVRADFFVDLRDLGVLVLGAGGAGRAIARQCAKESCERLVIASRTFEKANALAGELRDFFTDPKVFGPVPRLQAIAWDEAAIRFQIAHVDLIVNATSLGLDHSDPPPIPARLLAPHLMIFDTIYAKNQSPFVSAGLEAGARTTNGLSMLLQQGALAFEEWFHRPAPLEAMARALESA